MEAFLRASGTGAAGVNDVTGLPPKGFDFGVSLGAVGSSEPCLGCDGSFAGVASSLSFAGAGVAEAVGSRPGSGCCESRELGGDAVGLGENAPMPVSAFGDSFGALGTPPNKGLGGVAVVVAAASPSLTGEAVGVVLGPAGDVNPANGDTAGFAAGASAVFVVLKGVVGKTGFSAEAGSAGFAGSNIDFAGAGGVKPAKGDFACSVVAGNPNGGAAGFKAVAGYAC